VAQISRAVKNGFFFRVAAPDPLLPCTSRTMPPFGSPPLTHCATDAFSLLVMEARYGQR